ncbi:MAG: phosphoribosyltransferase [Nitrospiraceae bacterium]
MPYGEGPLFHDRHDAGRRLAQVLIPYKGTKDAIILALPRGGVVIGYELSRTLHLPLDVFVTRKLGTPGNPELAMGALTETGYRHLNTDIIQSFGVSPVELEEEVQRQRQEIERRIKQYRKDKSLPPLSGRTVLLVDDGIATGATFYASLAALRALNAGRLVAAVPVAPINVPGELRSKVEEAIILGTPDLFFGIGQFYEDFAQVRDEEVIALLEKAHAVVGKTGSTET